MKVLKSLLVLMVLSRWLWAVDYDEQPIDYSRSVADDPVARLHARMSAGEVTLRWDEQHGYLPSLLQELAIPQASQVLVFSKTSLQREFITPQRPRVIYFNDEVYVGRVQHSDVLEISSTDPRLGTIFYVSYNQRGAYKSERQTHECLQCHDSNGFTGGVPGLMMRSVYPAQDGRPILSAGSHVTDHRSPLQSRWGGWFVTGTTDSMGHLGNQWFADTVTPESVDPKSGANRVTLAGLIDTKPYLTAHSDVVALMVLGHQLQAHNLLTRAAYEGRLALRDDLVMNEALGRPKEFRSDTFHRRIASASEALLCYLLFVDEASLTGPVLGTTTFVNDFQALGPRDSRGRSLRDFDLKRRMFRYPLSYLIYSPSFDALPEPVLTRVYERLLAVLSATSLEDQFAHLSLVDRRAILEILVATKPGLPRGFAAFLR